VPQWHLKDIDKDASTLLLHKIEKKQIKHQGRHLGGALTTSATLARISKPFNWQLPAAATSLIRPSVQVDSEPPALRNCAKHSYVIAARHTMNHTCGCAKLEPRFSPSNDHTTAMATDILVDVMRFRRMANPQSSCVKSPCPACLARHLPPVISAIENEQPITFVLPGFPGKSPNLTKVLGPLPDMAERCSIKFLSHLCDRIRRHYSSGARVVLCSDGRVFSDVVGFHDEDVTAYQLEVSNIIQELSLGSIITFNLDHVYRGLTYDQMRFELMDQYGEALDLLKAAVRQGGQPNSDPEHRDALRLYRGITRFLVEDAMHPSQKQTRTAIQKACRIRAYEVIQRSTAWGKLIAKHFPNSVRLSIHPQACNSGKLGIHLMEAESWMTPWHGVAVDVGGRFVLLKRAQAEALGARLVTRKGRPSHFELTEEQNQLRGVLYGSVNATFTSLHDA
jgi:pyoverdine/dityrosine biosynthesis protein Dit1